MDDGSLPLPHLSRRTLVFAGLSAAVLSAADPVLIVALLAFVMASALGPILLPAPFPSAYLRPPLRGPPARLT